MKDFFNGKEWTDFIEKCRDRVKLDNKEFGIYSVFLPNPNICPNPECHNPRYCLIAMEPKDDKNRLRELENDLDGYQNFIEGYKELILHYCAYHHLGEKGFNYYITDISKGSMTMADAERSREKRWFEWRELLKEEINLLRNGNDITIIPIGKDVQDFVEELWSKNHKVRVADYILHHSRRNLGSIYDNPYCEKIDEEELKVFVDLFVKHLNYYKRKDDVDNVLVEKKGVTQVSKFYAYYRHKFQSIKHQTTENKQ